MLEKAVATAAAAAVVEVSEKVMSHIQLTACYSVHIHTRVRVQASSRIQSNTDIEYKKKKKEKKTESLGGGTYINRRVLVLFVCPFAYLFVCLFRTVLIAL